MRIVAIASAVLICCAATGQGTAPKTLVFCSQRSPDTFNPQLSASQATFDASARQVFDRLVMFDAKTREIVPALAQSWQISDDGLEYVFKLRPDVVFHATSQFQPTRELNAQDVVFTFARQLYQNHPWHHVSGGEYQYFNALGLDELIDSVTANGESRVTFRLKRQSASFLPVLAMDFASILSAEYAQTMWAAGTLERFDREPIGTGPFRLVQYQRDALIRYVAHRDYWRGPARLDNLVFAIIPDAGVRLQKLRNGECHVIEQPDPASLPALLGDPQVNVVQQASADLAYLAFNTEKHPLDDVRVRRALSLAIDRKAIVERVYGGIGIAATKALPPGLQNGTLGGPLPQPDPALARELLARSGQQGLSIDIWAMPLSRPYMRNALRVAEMIRDDWAAIGVAATISTPDWETFLKHSMLGTHKAILFGWIGDAPSADAFLAPILSCAGIAAGTNRSRWCDQAFDGLLLDARHKADRSERHTIYRAALARIDDQVPLVPLAHSISFTPLRRTVLGYIPSPFGGHSFYGVDLE